MQGVRRAKLIEAARRGDEIVIEEDGKEPVRLQCWAHTRRAFFDAQAAADGVREALEFIQGLCGVEEQIRERNLLGHGCGNSTSRPTRFDQI